MKKLFIVFYIVMFSLVLVHNVNALELEGPTDTFTLTDNEFDKDEKFVYSATLNFKHGQAGGLAFGAEEDTRYYVFNVDRFENKVKLLYFAKNDNGGYNVKELFTEYFIGNDKMTDREKDLVFPKVRDIGVVDLKVVITPEDDKVYAEFFAEGIKRFGIDNVIDLNNINDFDVKYQGGKLGYNIFNSKIEFTNEEVGSSDYAYYSELYRQQYHFSQYSKWNNDPNGLVYYNGYYHLFFQTHPYSKYWSDMYWGHARSKDLVNWEQLPICLFPDNNSGDNGYAWSGSARVYHKGDGPEEMDNWFPNGKGTGLIAFYTRDGAMQDQVIISSDDEGMTWTKRRVIPQSIIHNGRKIDCRDPKVFPINNGSKDIWGMVVSNMNGNTIYFLKSENMLDWSYAGSFTAFRPECVDVVELTADDNTTHTVLTLEGREYLVGELKYDATTGEIYFEKFTADGMVDVRALQKNVEETVRANNPNLESNKLNELIKDEKIKHLAASKMDFGPDSYATQSFFIDDPVSEYYGKTISVSWFSGVPGGEASAESGAFAAVRNPWNGGGFTIPVELGLIKSGNEYLLTQTPITLNNNKYDKEAIVNLVDSNYDENTNNILSGVDTHQLEINASFDNPNREEIEFKINIGEDEYTTIGWNKVDGYYVDRTNTSDAGINFGNYHRKYISGPTSSTTQSFYILSDNGGVEVFCDNFSIPFYVLTLPSVFSTKAELNVSGNVEIKNLEVNKINSIFRDEEPLPNEGVIYLSKENVRLDLDLTKSTDIILYSTLSEQPVWEMISGEGVVNFTETSKGITINSLTSGEAVIKVTCGNKEKEIKVTVTSGRGESDINFTKDGIVSGNWYQTSDGLIGNQLAGDGFILSDENVKDCYYTAQFNLGSGAAAALVLRASEDMSEYLIVNYDNNSRIVKAWTQNGELANVFVGDIDITNITLSAILEGNNVEVLLNGRSIKKFQLKDNDPKEGYLGLNVCATEAVFKAITIQKTDYEYSGKDLSVRGNLNQYIQKITNITNKNTIVDKSFYTVSGRDIKINEAYFATLKATGVYEFEVVGEHSTFIIKVNVSSLPSMKYETQYVSVGEKLNLYIANNNYSEIKVNGKVLTEEQYSIKNMILTIDSSLFNEGNNTLELDGELVDVNLYEIPQTTFIDKVDSNNQTLIIILAVAGGVILLAGAAVVVFIVLKKKRG